MQRKSLSGTAPGSFAPIQNTSALHPQQQIWNTAPTKQTYGNMSYPGAITSQPFSNQQTSYAPPIPTQSSTLPDPYAPQTPLSPAVPPPPPTSATSQSQSGSRPPSVGPHSRSKYLVDPSVKSGPAYGSTGGYGYGTPQSFPSPGGFAPQSPYGVKN